MTLSPKKYVSHYTTNTAQRGVEAKETESSNTNLELDMSNSTQFPAESSAGEAAPLHPASYDETGSYLQVVVEKHRARRAAAAAAASPRLPAASSPLAPPQGGGGGGGERGVFVLPHPVLLACATDSPMCAALQAHAYFTRGGSGGDGGGGRALAEAGSRAAPPKAGPAAAPAPHPSPASSPPLQKKNKTWKLFQDMSSEKFCDNEPDCVEVYYFEHGTGEYLATCAGGRPTAVERATRRGARAAGALLAELLAASQLLLALPVALLLHVQRCLLVALRGAATGLVQTASDYALKPALALTFNALVQPLLVFCGNVTRGVRAALQPLWLALGDAAAPAARLLAAARLADVRLACPHPHQHAAAARV